MNAKNNAAKTGFSAGFLNGLFGSGGGIIAVPLLQKSGLSQKESHATALFLTFCLSALSAGIYFFEGEFDFSEAAKFIPGGIIGSAAASVFFKKMNPALLRKIFGALVTFSAGRMLWNLVSEWV
ncbi:MAG: sulfite exporter TauE/SafE family protein [Oscillospiraceae bacterium]|nr:sulfite exporter TauE/SafE family protein [Oscillospiraceae bacterium]